jgi:hypothetical protein
MTSALRSRWQLALRIGVFSALAALGVAACHTVEYLYPKNLQGFVLPPGCPMGSAPADTTQLRACLTGIEFDTTEFVGDEQRLMVRDSGGPGAPCFGDSTHTCRHGPLARVDPVKGAEMYSNAALAQGRIIARAYLRAGETESYPKFGLTPGDTTYWWVSTAQDTSQFVRRGSGVSALTVTGRGLTTTQHPRGSFQQSFAQWVWDPVDETLNGACGSHCCRP